MAPRGVGAAVQPLEGVFSLRPVRSSDGQAFPSAVDVEGKLEMDVDHVRISNEFFCTVAATIRSALEPIDILFLYVEVVDLLGNVKLQLVRISLTNGG